MNKSLYFLVLLFVQFSCSVINHANKSIITNNTIIISPKKGLSHYLPKNFGHHSSPHENVKIGIYIPNNKEIKGEVLGLALNVKKSYIFDYTTKKSSVNELDKYAPFLVNFYEFDKVSKQPTRRLFEKDTLVNLQKGDKELLISKFNHKIPFTQNGIFITIEKLPTNKYKELGFNYGPAFGVIGVSKDNEIIPYVYNKMHKKVWEINDFLILRNNVYDVKLFIKSIDDE